MKKIEAIVRPEKMNDIQEALALAGVGGMTISQVHGCGSQRGLSAYYRGGEIVTNIRSKVKIEVVIDDGKLEEVIEVIRSTACTGEVGDGKIFVIPVEQAMRVRTGATGVDAL